MAFVSPRTGWMTGFDNAGHADLYVTRDSAHHWAVLPVTVSSAGRLTVMCGSEGGGGTQPHPAYSQIAFGHRWRRVRDIPEFGYIYFAFSNGTESFFTGGRAPLYVTSDGGRTWRSSITHDFGGDGYVSGGFADAKHGWLIVINAEDQATADQFTGANGLDVTDDGGRHWHQVLV